MTTTVTQAVARIGNVSCRPGIARVSACPSARSACRDRFVADPERYGQPAELFPAGADDVVGAVVVVVAAVVVGMEVAGVAVDGAECWG